MSLGPLMIDLPGEVLGPEDRELLRHPAVGGVILFSRNFRDGARLRELVAGIRGLREPWLLVAVDYEGGRVQRFRESGFTPLPCAASYGLDYDLSPARALAAAERCAWLCGTELAAADIDLPFAPVLDLNLGRSSVIGDRAFHSDPDVVAELGRAWMRGLRKAGLQATGKHYPGHGGVVPDSHFELPRDPRPANTLLMEDERPFQRLIDSGLGSVMMGHVVYGAVDADFPASLSRRWIERLRRELGFGGAVFCDDLSMGGAAECVPDVVERAERALAAGCDMLPVCNDRDAVGRLLDGLRAQPSPVRTSRLLALHRRPDGRVIDDAARRQAISDIERLTKGPAALDHPG